MVRNKDLSPGDLVSFLLYLQSLSDAFSSIGYIFASLTQAVGAADKGMYNDAATILSRFEVYLPMSYSLIGSFLWLPVFELMYRKPQFKAQTLSTPTTDVSQQDRTYTDEEMATEHVSLLPQQGDQEHIISTDLAIGGLGYISETSRKRCMGLEPENCYGEIVLDKVEMYYPARPQRKVLDQISLRVPPGKIAALVGQSGGGKSRYVGTLHQLKELLIASI